MAFFLITSSVNFLSTTLKLFLTAWYKDTAVLTNSLLANSGLTLSKFNQALGILNASSAESSPAFHLS